MSKSIIIGIDPSLRASGIVVLEASRREVLMKMVLKTKCDYTKGDTSSDKLLQRMRDHQRIYRVLSKILIANNPDLICMEGYSYGSKNALTYQAEVVGIIGLCILEYMRASGLKPDIIVIPPQSLKKFVTGKGSVKKNLMLKEVFRRWGFDTADDNIADAYSLSRIAMKVWEIKQYGIESAHLKPHEIEVLKKITWLKKYFKKGKKNAKV